MAFIQGLHGTVAILLLCSLLFAEEAGVPLPFAPGELTLIAAGLLIAAGAINPFIFLPLAVVACTAGALLGYSWASLIGTSGLRSVADRLHQQKAFDRVETRLRDASARDIAVSRLIPGLRIYTTLVAGAVGVAAAVSWSASCRSRPYGSWSSSCWVPSSVCPWSGCSTRLPAWLFKEEFSSHSDWASTLPSERSRRQMGPALLLFPDLSGSRQRQS